MDIIYVLIPLSIFILSIAATIFFWAVRSGQFDDLEAPAHRILFDEDSNDLPGTQIHNIKPSKRI
jgi:cbb3-type cytochrome oxidase maturation protein